MAIENLFGDYLANLAAELSAQVIVAIPTWVKSSWQGDETDMAVGRCLDAGLTAFMRRASIDAPAYTELLEIIFTRFFHDSDVVAQITRLLEGQRLNPRPLQFMAKKAGYQPEDFPTFDFDTAIEEFDFAFLTQATYEPTLQGVIEVSQLLQQTALLAGTQAILTEIVKLLQDIKLREISGITADSITATNVVGRDQHVYPLTPVTVSLRFPDHWESHYLDALINQCDRLDTTPLSASEATTDSLSIAAVFTTLYLENATRAEEETVVEALSPRPVSDRLVAKEERGEVRIEAKRTPITASEAVASMPRLVILGQPGGGKTTLVNYIAAQLARLRLGHADVTLPDWPVDASPLPVRIVLRRFADWVDAEKRSGTAGDVWDYIAYLLNRWGCADSFKGVRDALINGRGIVFFDGLDEIRDTAARQMIIKGAVTDFANTEKNCQIIITSRPYAYSEKTKKSEKESWRLPADRFPVVSLAPFADEQIQAFNEAWYTRVMGPRRGWDNEQCRQRASILTKTLLALPHLHDMAASPLLLTLMAQVHGQGGTLPDNRADLYRQTVELLLSRWENRIVLDARIGEDIKPEDVLWLGVTTGHLRAVLAQIAYHAHEKQGKLTDAENGDVQAAEISRRDLKLALVDRFDSGEKAEQIMAYIQNRAGLLLAQNDEIYTFPHRTFQEYLAAQHLLSRSNGQEILRDKVRSRPDWWREVFLLSAGSSMTVPKNVQDLVNALLPFAPEKKGWPITSETSVWVSIAAQALVETSFHEHVEQEDVPGGFTAVYERVQEWLNAIMTADSILSAIVRAEAGQWLSRLGDDRDGVGVIEKDGITIPDILWGGEVPTGTYEIGDTHGEYGDEKLREVVIKRPYQLAIYPITNAQFQCFIDAQEDENDVSKQAWWKGIPDEEQKFSEPEFPYANHPRERVSWYQTIAFCRWLSDKRGEEIRLPHEYEWEVAARWNGEGTDGRFYPWNGDFDANKANTDAGKSVGQTTAVGIYPSGRNEALDLYDMSGNVYEWCNNKYNSPEDDRIDDSGERRVLRGGSFIISQYFARAAGRSFSDPDFRRSLVGFRVVCVRPPSHQDH